MSGAAAARRARILLVDDHAFVRRAMASLLSGEADLEVVAEAGEEAQALQALAAGGIDLALVDLSLNGATALSLLRAMRARHPVLPVLVISMHDEGVYAERVLRAGANGYLMKQQAAEVVLAAVRKVLKGGIYVSERIEGLMLRRLVGRSPDGARTGPGELTDRELEVLRFIGSGVKSSEIARRMRRSVKTIDAHRASLKQKLGLRDAAELARYAARWAEPD